MAGRVGEVLQVFGVGIVIVGLMVGIPLGVQSMSNHDWEGIELPILIILGSLLQYTLLRLGSVLAYYVEDRYRGNV